MTKTLLLTACAVAILTAPRANATVEIRLASGAVDTGWLQCGDLGVVCLPGSITFVGAVDKWNINVSTGVSHDGIAPFLDLNSVNDTDSALANPLSVMTMADGYITQTPGWNFKADGNGSIGGTVAFAAYGGNNNNICAHGALGCDPTSPGVDMSLIKGFAPVASDPSFHVGGASGVGTTSAMYSLAITATITDVTKGGVSYDAALDPVPEPSSVALLGGVLLAAAGVIRRKIRRS